MSSPIPGLLLGKNPAHLQACVDGVQPAAEIIKKASTVEDARAAIQELLVDASPAKIKFVVMGGGFAMTDFEDLHQGEAATIPWFRPVTTQPGFSGPPPGGPPPPEVIAKKLQTAVDAHVDDLNAGKGSGEIWYF